MGLSRSQYQALMREYNRRQFADKHEQDERIEEVHAKLPAVAELEAEAAAASAACARRVLAGETGGRKALREQLADLREQKLLLMKSAGFPEDYMEMRYHCPDCQDTGYVDGQKCHCFLKEEMKLLYAQSNLEEVLERENFAFYTDKYYSRTDEVPGLGISQYNYMRQVKKQCLDFVKRFPQEHQSLLFQGDTGVGKSFLTNCIAKALIDNRTSVLYLSARQLFEIFGHNISYREDREEMQETYRHILDCDLLIIDDLGTELNNSFVSSSFFFCINERLLRRKGTIISTNLDLDLIRDRYTDRVASRIFSEYHIIPLYGQDIRAKKG